MKRFLRRQEGVAMVEATIGTVLLLLAGLATMQLVLVLHGVLAQQGAVVRAARTYAITVDAGAAKQTFDTQMGTALGSIHWSVPTCSRAGSVAQCTVTITIPSVLPGAGLFTGSSAMGPISQTRTGVYPYGEKSGN